MLEVARAGTTVWSPKPLLGHDVRVRWTGYDPRSCDLRFQRLARATSIDESIALLDQAQGIPLNVLVADASGHVAHLAIGLLPRRHADAPDVADGYLAGTERPRLVDPPAGILVSANDAALPEYPYRIGYDVDPGYRARRVRRMLTESPDADPATMRAMQHDTRAELYLPYRDLAVSALRGRAEGIATILAEWNGHADVDSLACGVLVRLREVLARRVLSPYLSICRDHDPDFLYAFQAIDRPLLAIIGSGDPSLLPPGAEGDGWDGLVARCVDGVLADLVHSSGGRTLPTWGDLNRVGLRHPLEQLAPWASALLSVAASPQAGALHCVRTCVPGFSAVGRAILRPGPHGGAEFEMPGGQSGHPLSRHYDDRHRDWSGTTPRGTRRDRRGCRFVLRAAGPR
jgi:penicillin amidase